MNNNIHVKRNELSEKEVVEEEQEKEKEEKEEG